MSGPYQRRDLINCGTGRLRVANDCGVLSVTRPCRMLLVMVYGDDDHLPCKQQEGSRS